VSFQLHNSWQNHLKEEFNKPYFTSLMDFVQSEYDTNTIYPPKAQMFAAFDRCPWDKVKVVIIGQDPYHGPGQANGLCFSVSDGIPHPPSLKNIFKELQTDLDLDIPASGNLERWANQGVLLLNATLTVEAHKAGSHQKKGWETFTDAVIQKISSEKEGIVFLLWGGYAQKKGRKIDATKHLVLKSGHPSPLSANRGFWFGNGCFNEANEYLKSIGREKIAW
jgi:uracil-DNA glycosylase